MVTIIIPNQIYTFRSNYRVFFMVLHVSSGLVLTSLRYWENFVSSSFYLTKNLKIRARKLHKNLDNARFQTGFVFSLVKCFIVVGMTFLVGVVLENDSYTSDHVLHNANGELDPYTGTRFSRISNLLSYGGRRSKNR